MRICQCRKQCEFRKDLAGIKKPTEVAEGHVAGLGLAESLDSSRVVTGWHGLARVSGSSGFARFSQVLKKQCRIHHGSASGITNCRRLRRRRREGSLEDSRPCGPQRILPDPYEIPYCKLGRDLTCPEGSYRILSDPNGSNRKSPLGNRQGPARNGGS